MKKLLILISITLLAGCALYKPVVPTQSDVDRAVKYIPGVTLAELQQGKEIFEKKCHKCHSLKKPFDKTDNSITAAMPKMAKRSKIDSNQEKLVLNYLVTMNSGR